jgi:hypothetical protein
MRFDRRIRSIASQVDGDEGATAALNFLVSHKMLQRGLSS